MDEQQDEQHAWRVIEPIEHDHVRHEPGTEITLTDAVAAPLIAAGAIALITPGDDADVEAVDVEVEEVVETDDAETETTEVTPIAAAIAKLDPDDPAQWTRGGAPQVSALEALLDRDVTSAERDAAWAAYQATPGVEAG